MLQAISSAEAAILPAVSWRYAAALETLVGKRGRTALVRKALGEDASPTRVKSVANYLSRILSGRVQSPGDDMLRLIARGLDCDSLAELFQRLEPGSVTKGNTRGDNSAHARQTKADGQNAVKGVSAGKGIDKVAPKPRGAVGDHLVSESITLVDFLSSLRPQTFAVLEAALARAAATRKGVAGSVSSPGSARTRGRQ